jgi:hypothetical protein
MEINEQATKDIVDGKCGKEMESFIDGILR